MAVVVKGYRLYALVLLRDRVKVHRHAPQLAVGIGAAGDGEYLLGPVIRFAADAEHVLFISIEITLSEALPRKSLRQHAHLFRRGLAPFLYGLGVYAGHYGRILRALHAPLDLHAGHACLFKLAQSVDKAVVLERHRVVIHPPAEGILHAAWLGAHTAVAAAAAYQRGHIALAGVAEAQRAVDEHLRLYRRILRYVLYLLKTQLSRQHGASHAHLRRSLNAGQIVYAHLGARMQGNIRQCLPDRGHEAEILYNYPVRAASRREARVLHGRAYLSVVHERVERDVHLAAAHMAVTNGLLKFLICKILCAAAGIEVAKAHIYRVRAVLHSGDDRFRRSGGRKKFEHCISSS